MGTPTSFAFDDLLGAASVADTLAFSLPLATWYRRRGATDAGCAARSVAL